MSDTWIDFFRDVVDDIACSYVLDPQLRRELVDDVINNLRDVARRDGPGVIAREMRTVADVRAAQRPDDQWAASLRVWIRALEAPSALDGDGDRR